MNMRVPSDPHLRRWMLFVDGENFAIRGQELAKERDLKLVEGPYYIRDVFVWMPGILAGQAMTNTKTAPLQVQPRAIRSYYYTSLMGDEDRLTDTKKRLRRLGFHPRVFKRLRKGNKAKGVDIALTTDVLSDAFNDNYDVAVIVTGDGDYLPVVSQVQRLGKVVYVCFFAKWSSEALATEADLFFGLTGTFAKSWQTTDPEKPPAEEAV